MCDVDEEDSGQLEVREVLGVVKICVKCKENPAALVIRAGDAFCRGCFKEYFTHKFRAMLGKNRILFPGEKVLLAVSGGPSSCSMLYQVQEGLSLNAHKKLRFIPGIVFIDGSTQLDLCRDQCRNILTRNLILELKRSSIDIEVPNGATKDQGGALGLSAEERQRTTADLQAVFKATGFPYHIVPLEQVFHLPCSVLEPGSAAPDQPADSYKAAVDHFISNSHMKHVSPEKQTDLSRLSIQEGIPDESNTQALQRLFSSVKTLTAKEDLLYTLRRHLLVHTARSEGYTKLMVGDNCTRQAVKLLASIALGRGAQLGMDAGFSDHRYSDTVTVRPMRDYSAKEISFYNYMFKVPFFFIPSLDTKMPDKASIQRLTESFVTKLQADFPSTVSTIYRTGDKLQTVCPAQKSLAVDDTDKCLLCLCTLDTAAEDASAVQATLISDQLSQKKQTSGGSNIGSPTLTTGQCCSSQEEKGRQSCGGTGDGSGTCCSSAKVPQTLELKSLLCYSCRLTIKDMSSVEDLPDYILSEGQKRKNRSEMRQEIREFLLDEDDDDN